MGNAGDEGDSATEGDGDAPLLETVARNVPVVLFALDGDGVFTRSEGRGLAALDLEPNQTVGESVFDVYADYPSVVRAVERALAGETVAAVHEFGDVAFETWYRPVGDDEVERILGVAVDVSERARYDRLFERLNEASRRLLEAESNVEIAERVVDIARGVLEQPFTGVWFHDPERGGLELAVGDGPARSRGHAAMPPDSVEVDVYRSGTSRLVADYGAVPRAAFPDAAIGTALLVPLGEHGLMTVASPEVVGIESVDRDLIEILARDATVALDRTKREHLLERVNEATRKLVVADSEREIAEHVVEIAREVLDEQTAVVWFYDVDADVLHPVAGTRDERREGQPARPFHDLSPITAGTAEMRAFHGDDPVFFDDYASVEDAAHPEAKLGAILAVPIGDLGLLTLGAPTAEEVGTSTPHLVEILARDAAVAIERARRESTLQHLHAATRALMAAETPEEIAQRAVDTTEDVLGHPMAVIRLRSPDGERLEPVARSAYIREHLRERPGFRVGEGTIGTVFERGEVRCFDRSELVDLDVEDVTRTLLAVPVGGHGVLTIGESEPSAFEDADVQLAKILASNVETALDRVERERELERRNERLDQFARIVSHDLRNPLNVIDGHVELAAVAEPHRSSITRSIDRIRTLVEDVLELARQGRVVSDPEAVDLARVARRAWASVETEEATLSVATAAHRVLADDARLQRLFENLIRNAVEHGGPGVTVTVGATDDGFYVEDDGPGIPDDALETVFEAGYTTADDGTGIGLAIVAEIAEAHGWSVSAASGRDGGARFAVSGVQDA